MAERTLRDSRSPLTQSIEAVKSLLDCMGRANDPLPTFLELPNGHCILVLSDKQDAYYTVTAEACSCPSACFEPEKTCKHRLTYFPKAARENIDTKLSKYKPIDLGAYDSAIERLWKPPKPVFRDEIIKDYDGPVVA